MLQFLPIVFLLLQVTLGSSVVKIRDSPITLPIAVRINTTGSANILQMDQARAQHLIKAAKERAQPVNSGKMSPRAVVNLPLTNTAVCTFVDILNVFSPAQGVNAHTKSTPESQVAYTAPVRIGNPATQYTFIVDTGSGDTLIDGTLYVRTNTSVPGPCLPSGTCVFTDLVDLGGGLVIPHQAIGVTSLQGADGILGLGTDQSATIVPTVPDNLFSQSTLTADEISFSFEPTTSASVTNGEYTFGGTDSSKFTGSIIFTGITATSPASEFWGINQSIRFGTSTNILSTTAGILDTGTTLVLIATDAFDRYKTASGGVLDASTGLLRLTTAQFNNLSSLFFLIGTTNFELTANAQAWPRSLNTLIGGVSGSVYLIVGDIGTPSGQGLDFINGFTFLERFYSVLDTTNKRVGLATTPFTHATTN